MSKIDYESWLNFVLQHPNGNIFQSPLFYKICLKTNKQEPIVIHTSVDGNITGVMLAVIMKEHSGFLGLFSTRSIIIGAPLVMNDDSQYLEDLLVKYKRAVKGKVIYSQFRNLLDCNTFKKVFKKHGFEYEPHLNILIDLTNLEKLEEGISKNKKRNITKSKNKGVIFREIESKEELDLAINLVLSTYRKIGLPIVSREYFENAFSILNPINQLKVFGAFIENKMIGTRMELMFNGLIYDWYAGSDDMENTKYPNDFLIYNILLWGHHAGFKRFDFGGAGKPDQPYGVREHKLKFSQNIVEYGRFEYIHNKPLYLIGTFGLKFYKYFNGLLKHIFK